MNVENERHEKNVERDVCERQLKDCNAERLVKNGSRDDMNEQC
jgi:hypothetical protein